MRLQRIVNDRYNTYKCIDNEQSRGERDAN